MNISNNRLVKITNRLVIFQYETTDTDKTTTGLLSAREFTRCFPRYILNMGLLKVSCCVFFGPGLRAQLKCLHDTRVDPNLMSL